MTLEQQKMFSKKIFLIFTEKLYLFFFFDMADGESWAPGPGRAPDS